MCFVCIHVCAHLRCNGNHTSECSILRGHMQINHVKVHQHMLCQAPQGILRLLVHIHGEQCHALSPRALPMLGTVSSCTAHAMYCLLCTACTVEVQWQYLGLYCLQHGPHCGSITHHHHHMLLWVEVPLCCAKDFLLTHTLYALAVLENKILMYIAGR